MSYATYSNTVSTRFSGTEEIPSSWEARRLKFAVTYNDETLPETTDPDAEIAYVDISSVDLVEGITKIEQLTFEEAPSRARRIVKDGDTIISTVRTYLKAIAAIEDPPENMIVSTGFAVIRPLEFVHRRYLGYALQGVGFVDRVVANSTGVSYPAINPPNLVTIAITYPEEFAEQKQIADFLDWKTGQIDALIAKKRQLIEKLQEQRIAVITQAVTKGLNPDAPMRDSGIPWLGEVPRHWEVRRLKYTASMPLKYGANESAEFEITDWPRYVRITDIRADGKLHEDTFRSLPPEIAQPYLLNEGDILLARSGATVGKTFQYSGEWGAAAYAGYLIRYSVDSAVCSSKYTYLFTKSSVYWANINSTLIQSTIQNFSAERYASIPVPVPPIAEQVEIVVETQKLLDKINALQALADQAIDRLTEFRSALITAATTGKIDVRDVQIPVTE